MHIYDNFGFVWIAELAWGLLFNTYTGPHLASVLKLVDSLRHTNCLDITRSDADHLVKQVESISQDVTEEVLFTEEVL